MYANATEALEGLRHKRTREHLPSKVVARNTKLIYFADELVGLKLHDTVIALYRPDGVTIDLRGEESPNGEGWFTSVTLERIDRFTPVRTIRERGLTKIVANPVYGGGDWTAPARLYAHGCSRSCDGSFENGIEPAIERHIERLHAGWNRKADDFAKRCIAYWRHGGVMLECCCKGDGDTDAHLIGHVESGEPCVPWRLANLVATAKGAGMFGDDMADALADQLGRGLRELSTTAIKTVEPNFPYPQLTRI